MPTYKPTGKPPGRPRKDGLPAGTKPEPKPVKGETPKASKPPGWMGPVAPVICRECYPDGWGPGWTGVSCQHGIWTRRV